ncbi:uncharacterized protein LOC125031434 [Penaeus chinensis]|uniref:uncharacterized protein LOC125031429 n=1 Tax=Penaeus chinensis TaxID=139456 RepID=UPI001FB58C7A|nr:uncharacterized protein LOC125031429 [Penaeus chinensis]XP_047478128.1 uncharacterized protein LOC125031434 [Penaeus chinensis]
MVWEPSACCGIGRRTAGYVIASITVIYCIFDLVLSIYYLSNGHFNDMMDARCNKLPGDEYQTRKCIDVAHKTFNVLISVRLVMEILHIIFSFLLMHGIRKNNPRLMVPYLVMMLIAIVLLTLFSAIMVVLLLFLSVTIALVVAIVFGGIIFIMTYFNLVVRAYYKEINEPLKNNFKTLKA